MTPRRRHDNRVIVPVMFVATLSIVVMDGAITNVALPAIAGQFRVPVAGVDGVVVTYPVCVGMAILVSGWLGDRFGEKPVLLIAMAFFTAVSALCGTAGSLDELVFLRGLQGLSGGLLTPVVSTMLFRTFTAQERVRVSRTMIVPQQLAPSIAPMLGGLLVDGLSWRWVFYVNIPLGVLTVLFGLLFLEDSRQPPPSRFDLPGFLLSAAGVSALMYGLCEGAQQGWGSPVITASLAGSAMLLTTTVVYELRSDRPVLRLRLFTDRLFRNANVLNLVALVPFMGAMYLGPLFLQEALGATALQSGSSTFTEAIGVLLTVQLVARLYGRLGPRSIIATGLMCVTAALVLLATCTAHTGMWTFRLYMFALGLGMGAVFMPVTVASFSTVPKAHVGQASTMNAVLRQLSTAIAPALAATLLAAGGPGPSSTAAPGPPVHTYRTAYLVLAGIALVSCLFAAFSLRGTSEPGAGAAEDDSYQGPAATDDPCRCDGGRPPAR